MPPLIVIVMGVAGCGKTTVGRALAQALGRPFFDGDDFHPPENVARMGRGEPLRDRDRAPWLAALGGLITDLIEKQAPAVLACSALKRAYRNRLAMAGEVYFVYLAGSYDLFRERLQKRQGHFMHADLLRSQFDDLEVPAAAEALHVDAGRPVADQVADILDGFKIQ